MIGAGIIGAGKIMEYDEDEDQKKENEKDNGKGDTNGKDEKEDPNGNKEDGFNAEPIVLIATPAGGASGDPKILDSGKNKCDAFYKKDGLEDGTITAGGAGGIILAVPSGKLGNELFEYDLDARTGKEKQNDLE